MTQSTAYMHALKLLAHEFGLDTRTMLVERENLRDRFALVALQGIITSAEVGDRPEDVTKDALKAYEYADAMLIARRRPL